MKQSFHCFKLKNKWYKTILQEQDVLRENLQSWVREIKKRKTVANIGANNKILLENARNYFEKYSLNNKPIVGM